MFSDSDEDFSYTNSASILQALKKDISLSESDGSQVNLSMDVSSPEKNDLTMDLTNNSNIVNIPDDTRNSGTSTRTSSSKKKDIVPLKQNDSFIVLSDADDTANNTTINIISTIDNILDKGKKKGKQSTRGKTPTRGRGMRSGRGRGSSVTPPIRRTIRKRNCKINNYLNVETSQPQPVKPRCDENIICVADDENNDLHDANYEIDIKVWWMSQYIEKITIRRFDKINALFEHFAKKENISKDRLLFTIGKNDMILSQNDTPDSLNINAATIIEGGVLSVKSQSSAVNNRPDKSLIEFKVQMKDSKRPLTISMRITDRMEVLMYKSAAEIGVEVNMLKFYFDGDLIKSTNTPDDLQLEGGECIDCIKK